MNMNGFENDVDELLELALNGMFPKTESIEPEIMKELTNFLEANEKSFPQEDAEHVRGQIRKAMIHFKNRPYLYQTRKKVETLLKEKDNFKRFSIAPNSFVSELTNAGLTENDVEELKESVHSALKTYQALKTMPNPSLQKYN